MKTNKEKGRAGLAMAIAYYTCCNYTISLPLNDTQDYDLIVDNGEKLLKVQVKCSGNLQHSGNFIVSLRSCGGTKGAVYKKVISTDVDLIFILCTNGWMFNIPKEELKTTNSIVVGKSSSLYSKFLVHIPFVSPQDIIKPPKKQAKKGRCIDCGKEIRKQNKRCKKCEAKRREEERKTLCSIPNADILLKDITNYPMTKVGEKYGVCDNTIRKWCKKLGLPFRKKDIKLNSVLPTI